jgi:hypothetical protein
MRSFLACGRPARDGAGRARADDVGDPVAVGAQRQVRGAGRRIARGDGACWRRAAAGVPLAQPAAGRRHLAAAAGLRVDQGEQPDVRQLVLARVADLHGEHLMPGGEPAQRLLPGGRRGAEAVLVEAVEEVGDHHDQPAPATPGAALDRVGETVVRRPARRAAEQGRAAGRAGGRPPRAGNRRTPRR